MTDARNALSRIGSKYSQIGRLTPSQLNVLRVLHQLKPFLIRCGIKKWEKFEFESWDWKFLDQEFGQDMEQVLQKVPPDASFEELDEGVNKNSAVKRKHEPPDLSDPRNKRTQKQVSPPPKRFSSGK
jgi:hypothetical protein